MQRFTRLHGRPAPVNTENRRKTPPSFHPLQEANTVDRVTSELIDAAQSGEAALLDRIDTIDARYHKVILAAMTLSLSALSGSSAPHRITSVR
jgi:hypothetical protein